MNLREIIDDFRTILRGNIGILFVTWILLGFGGSIVHRFDGIYFSALGASATILGLMGALTFGMMALLQIPGGYLADIFGRKRVIVTFTFVMAFSMLIFAFAPSWQYIVIGLIISNVTLLYQPALFSILMDSLPENQRAEGFAITNISMIPGIFGPIIGGVLIATYGVIGGMRLGYLILFFLAMSAALLRMQLKETLHIKRTTNRTGFFESFKILRNLKKESFYLLFVNVIISGANGLIGYFIVKYSVGYTSAFMFGLAMATMTFVMVVVSIPVAKIADTYGKERFFVAGIFLYAAATGIFIVPTVTTLFLYSILSGLGMAILQPSNSGLIADYVGKENRGRYMGVYLFLSYISAMFGSIAGGFIYSENSILLFLISASVYFVAAVIAIRTIHRYSTNSNIWLEK